MGLGGKSWQCATLKVDTTSSNNKTISGAITTLTLQRKSIRPNLPKVPTHHSHSRLVSNIDHISIFSIQHFLTLDIFCCIKSHQPPEMLPPSKKIVANLIPHLLWSYLDCDFCVCCSFGLRADLEFPPYKQQSNQIMMNFNWELLYV